MTFFWVLSDFISNKTESFSLGPDLMKCEDEQVLIEKVSGSDYATSNAALWMLLLLRLTAVTTDDRLELRNSEFIFDLWSVMFKLTSFQVLFRHSSEFSTLMEISLVLRPGSCASSL